MVQRTKRIDETQQLLLDMLEDLTSGTDQERQEFMAVCVETLNNFKKSDMLTPIFVFERLCSIIHPVRFTFMWYIFYMCILTSSSGIYLCV